MLKPVLSTILLLTTTMRLGDIVYVLATNSSNLPLPVFAVAIAMIIYGGYLLAKKRITGNVRLKQFMLFFTVQTVMIAFNLTYMALNSPLQVGFADTLLVGTFLDILINCGVLYFGMKHMRFSYVSLTRSLSASEV